MKTVLLPSGMKCRPKRLKRIYRSLREFDSYCEVWNVACRMTGNPHADPRFLWRENPLVVSSVEPSDLAIYNPEIHPAILASGGAR